MRDEEVARLLEGIEMPKPAESFAVELEARVAATRPRRRAPVVALAVVAAAATVAVAVALWPWHAPEPPVDPAAQGFALAKAKRYKEAVAAFDRAIALHPAAAADSDPAWAWLHINRAVALASDGRLDEAVEGLRDVIRYEPGNSLAFGYLGAVLLRCGDTHVALASLQEAIRLDPASPVAWAGLVPVLLQMGRVEEALAASDRALAMDPGDARTHLLRAGCLRALGRVEEAAAAEARAREIDPAVSPEGFDVRFLGPVLPR